MFLSSINCLVNTITADQFYGAIAVFTLPVAQLPAGKINMFIVNQDANVKQAHMLPNTITGSIAAPPLDYVLLKLKESDHVESS